MKIRCRCHKQFIETIYELVTHGLTFDADADTFIITLTGGY